MARWIDCNGGLDVHHHALLQAPGRMRANTDDFDRAVFPDLAHQRHHLGGADIETDDHFAALHVCHGSCLFLILRDSGLCCRGRSRCTPADGQAVGVTQVDARNVRNLFFQGFFIDGNKAAHLFHQAVASQQQLDARAGTAWPRSSKTSCPAHAIPGVQWRSPVAAASGSRPGTACITCCCARCGPNSCGRCS